MKRFLNITTFILSALVLWQVGSEVAIAQTKEPSPDKLTMEELEQMALQNNPTLAQAAAEIRAATGRKLQAGLYPNPTVGYLGEEIRGGFARGGQQGFFLGQEIVLGGKLRLSRQIFEQERKQADAEAEEQRLRVVNGVRFLFVQGLAAQRTVALQRQLHGLAQEAVRTSRQLFNVGQADAPDVLSAEVEAQQVELSLIAAEQNQQRAWKALAATVGRPDFPLTRLEGNLEEIPDVNPEQWLETLLRESPAVKIAELGAKRAEAALARARREPIPNLQIRGGLQQNREPVELTRRPVGLQGFAELGVQIPIFNRNQGNVRAAKAELERAQQELQRVKLVLRERAAAFVQSYLTARAASDRYKKEMLPRARQAYDMYFKKYQSMAAAYPQVLIAQRTLFQLEVTYVAALENLGTSAVTLKSFLLTDGLEAPSRPGDLDRPVREVNLPSRMTSSAQER